MTGMREKGELLKSKKDCLKIIGVKTIKNHRGGVWIRNFPLHPKVFYAKI